MEWPAIRPRLDLDTGWLRKFSEFYSDDFDTNDQITSPILFDRSSITTFSKQCKSLNSFKTLTPIGPIPFELRWSISYFHTYPDHQYHWPYLTNLAQTNLDYRITKLIAQSSSDCHKNLLWYKLFDVDLKGPLSLVHNTDVDICSFITQNLSFKQIEVINFFINFNFL